MFGESIDLLKNHWIIAIVLTILFGVVSNALWEVIAKPIGSKVAGALFSLLTLGRKAADNEIYREASRRNQGRVNLLVLTLATYATFAALVYVATDVYFMAINPPLSEYLAACTAVEDEAEMDECTTHAISDAHSRGMKTGQFLFVALVLSTILFAARFLYILLKLEFANRIIAHFDQCVRICGPFLSFEDRAKIEQDFALMRDSEKYAEIFSKLQSVAKENGVDLP